MVKSMLVVPAQRWVPVTLFGSTVAAISIDPLPLVMLIPVPARVALFNVLPVELPIRSCPSV